ncbi:tRNA (adenosine(37)-N6)-dimethylallyltransferase MiaA [bacterium]|nr:tRNA (adenosine(37)-N6)-dimethylallyltransferase MiaA [bacterium]
MNVNLIVLAGPTASGKTAVALELARVLDTEIVCCDSRQIYKHFTIGTAKPGKTERALVRHHLLDLFEPWEIVNASDYMKEARRVIDALIARGKVPLLVGGTGLYIRAVLQGIFIGPPTDPTWREELIAGCPDADQGGLHALLHQYDPASAARIAPGDSPRILRALEVLHFTGRTMSSFQQEHSFKDCPYHYRYFYLQRDRQDLYNRINQRIDLMIEQGWLNEVRTLLTDEKIRHSSPMSSIGYRQMADYLTGTINLEQAVELCKRDTRRYAKRQSSWFRKEKNCQPIVLTADETAAKTATRIMKLVREKTFDQNQHMV